MCRAFVIFLLAYSKQIGQVDLSSTLNMFIKSAEIFKRHLKKKFQLKQKSASIEVQNLVGIFWQPPIFGVETFFHLPLETFLLTLRTCSRYLKGTSNLVVYARNKIMTVQHTNQNILANNKIMTWAETKKLIEISNPRKLSASRKWCPQWN